MKKKVALLIVIVMVIAGVIFALKSSDSAGGDSDKISIEQNDESINKDSSADELQQEQEQEEKESKKGTKDPDEIVDVKLPLAFVDEKYRDNLSAYAKDNGYISAKLNSDGKTITVQMKALSYDLYKIEMGLMTMRAICELYESKDYAYFTKLGEYEEDFTEVTVLVNSNKYNAATNKEDFFEYIANCCAYYLMVDNDAGNRFEIIVCDDETGEKIEAEKFNKKDYIK